MNTVNHYFGTTVLTALLIMLFAPAAHAQKAVRQTASASLESASPYSITYAGVNEFECLITSDGYICYETGLWPKGTLNQNLYKGAIEVTGIIPRAADCVSRETSNSAGCFPWAGDTTGMLVHREVRNHVSALDGIYSSLSDLDEWPDAPLTDFPTVTGLIHDTDVFDTGYAGRPGISEQDTWTTYWDADLVTGGGRNHPMGLLVEQRSLAWNHPHGNEATIYLVYRLTNVTGTPAFQSRVEDALFDGANQLPDAGWPLDSVYFGFMADPDVSTDYSQNYMSFIPALDMAFAYKNTFADPDSEYPATEFHPPFIGTAPGFFGMKFVRTPVDPTTGEMRGLTSFTVFTGGGAFPIANELGRVWRTAALRLDPAHGDPSCIVPIEVAREQRYCWLPHTVFDMRGSMSTGPFRLDPGESETIIVAIMAAATVETPLITQNTDNKPGLPALLPGCGTDSIRAIEVAAGWVNTASCPAPGKRMDAEHVDFVPGSLIAKALVAQAMADNGFMMPRAPEPPPFFLIPGNNRITIVWEPSPTEDVGDPFFALASDESSALYDPNFRRNDVEGYRVYRGTSPDDMELIAQFDKSGTVFRDVLCVTDPRHLTGDPCTQIREMPLTRELIQNRTVVILPGGNTHIVEADTAPSAAMRAQGKGELTDSGIPFSFVDEDVRNGFNYFYRVTAFDINSIMSGPSSLESASPVKNAVPRSNATSIADADVELLMYGRGRALDVDAVPTIHPVAGTFSGPQSPATIEGEATILAGSLLSPGATHLVVDSVVPEYYPYGSIATYHLTIGDRHASVRFTNRTILSLPETETMEVPPMQITADAGARADFISRGFDAPTIAAQVRASITVDKPHWNSLHADWARAFPALWRVPPPESSEAGGSRWFSGAEETLANPTLNDMHGTLDGVVTIFQPRAYSGMSPYQGLSPDFFRRFNGTVMGLTRAADVRLFWGPTRLDSVIDVTHNVPVPFSPAVRASYGFLSDADEDGVLTYGDFYYLEGLETSPPNEIDQLARAFRPLQQQPVIMPVDIDGDLDSDGSGFGLYINGEPYLFRAQRPMSTTWTLRTYSGAVTRDATGYSFQPTARPPAVPGLSLALVVNEPASVTGAEPDLESVHTVPDPYYARSIFDGSPMFRNLQFVNLPARATIRIYTISGVLVDVIVHDDPMGGGTAEWDLRGRGNHRVSNGVYLYHVSTPDGRMHIGRFTVLSPKGG